MRLLDKLNIAVITFPFHTVVPEIFLANFIDLLEPLSNEIYAITGNFSYKPGAKIHIINIRGGDEEKSKLKNALIFLLAQPRVAFNLLKRTKDIDIVIFFIGTRIYLLPLLTAKLLRKRTVLIVTGSESKAAKIQYGKKLLGLARIYSALVGILQRLNLHLADQIAVESKGTINFQGLHKFKEKIALNGAMYIDTNLFTPKQEPKDKKNLIGYIGRLSPGKGVLSFTRAMPLILKAREDARFLIGGDGPLLGEIKSELENKEWADKVQLLGWIPHDEVSDYLKETKLLVLPSDNEGVPAVVQEAMACGTPVLATAVGAIPDLIQDEKTGFILEDNSPECIARNIIRALEHPNLSEITQNARNLIEEEYSYEAMVAKCKIALDELTKTRDIILKGKE